MSENILSLPSAGTLTGTESFYLVQAGSDKVGLISQILDYIGDESNNGSLTDGDKGDIVVSSGGTVWKIPNSVITNFGRSLIHATDAAAAKTLLGLVSTTFQPYAENLTALSEAVSAADKLPYFNGVNTVALATFTGFARTLLDDADAAAMRTTLGIVASIPNAVVTLTDASSIVVDASLSNNFRITLSGNRTLTNPTNLSNGQVINFRIIQDGTGSRTLAYGSKYKFAGGAAPVLSTIANTKDFMSCQYDSTDDTLFCVLNKAFS